MYFSSWCDSFWPISTVGRQDAVPHSHIRNLGYDLGCCNEGTAAAYALKLKDGFGYHTIFDKMMYVHVTCHLDICYAISTMSKFST